ncbi:MAG: heme ABC exporter ATP-binding protein CcmA [Paracoccaceae bacterium]
MDLEIEAVDIRRGGRTVLAGITAELPAGRIAELRGPNGVGKSTLLRAIAGLVPVTGGDIRLGAVSVRRDRTTAQERIAYAGHQDGIKPALTVAENLAAWAGLVSTPETRRASAMARFGLDRIAERRAADCSAGQKRRLGLARLLLADRPLWLLDEPTVSLDRDATALVAALIAEHADAGGSVLVATHTDLGLSDPLAIALEPPNPRANPGAGSPEDDPFLAGAW